MSTILQRTLSCAAFLAACATVRVAAEDRAPAAPEPARSVAPPPASPPPKEPATTKKSSDKKSTADSTAAKPVAPPLSPRFQQVRDHIKALYGERDQPHATYDPRFNPFRTQPVGAEAAPVTTAATKPTIPGTPPPTVSTNATLLKQASALLKVTGFVERDGRTLLNINQALYKEGDVIKVTVQGQPVLLRATKVSRTSLTVNLNGLENTLKF